MGSDPTYIPYTAPVRFVGGLDLVGTTDTWDVTIPWLGTWTISIFDGHAYTASCTTTTSAVTGVMGMLFDSTGVTEVIRTSGGKV